MPTWLLIGLQMIGFAIVILVIYNLLKIYVFSKIKVNKWIVLTSAVIIFMVPIILPLNLPWNLWTYIPSGIFVILLLWFMDLSGFSGRSRYENKNKKNEIVMKPKAKPNRIKNK